MAPESLAIQTMATLPYNVLTTNAALVHVLCTFSGN